MDAAVQITGFANSWSQPISTRVVMQDTGIQTPVGLKVKGPELASRRAARPAGRTRPCAVCLRRHPSSPSGSRKAISWTCRWIHERQAAASLTSDEVLTTWRQGVGGESFAQLSTGGTTRAGHGPVPPSTSIRWRRFATHRSSPPTQRIVPLQAVAEVEVRKAPEMIRNDNGKHGRVCLHLSARCHTRRLHGTGAAAARAGRWSCRPVMNWNGPGPADTPRRRARD